DQEDFGFRLEAVRLEDEEGRPIVDEDGDEAWTCVVKPVAEEAMPVPHAERRKLGDVETIVMQAVAQLCGLVCHTTEAAVIELTASRMARGTAKRDQRKRRAEDAVNSLSADGLLAVEDGKVSQC